MKAPVNRRAVAALLTGVAVLAAAPVWAAEPAEASAMVSAVDEDDGDEDGAAEDTAPEDTAPEDSDEETTDEAAENPLEVVIGGLSPSVVPTRGQVTVSGEIRNRSTERWTELNVYLITSPEPITTRADLEVAIESDPAVDVGPRIVDPDLFARVPDLDPGESTPFRLSVPSTRLGISGAPGVYWLGVHVLGAVDGGRTGGADGRARTFLPLVPAQTPGVELALGLQLRRHSVRSADGRLRFPEGWGQTFGAGGRLGRLLGLGGTAAGFPLTWVVDPALLESARSVATGNPALDLQSPPDPDDDPAEDPDGDPAGDPGDRAGGTPEVAEPPEDSGSTDGATDEATDEAEAAVAWLDSFAAEAAGAQVLALPFADLDVTSAIERGRPELVDAAFGISARLLDQVSVPSAPVVVPPSGFMSPAAVVELARDVPLVLAPDAVEGSAQGSAGPVLDRADGGRVVVAPPRSSLWGPRPRTDRSALAVRQRLLADAALHALSPDRERPLVRLLPYGWNPGHRWREARFFRGLELPWLSGTSLAAVLGGSGEADQVDSVQDIAYPPAEAEAELPLANFLAAERLIEEGRLLEELLTDNTVVDDELTRQALVAVSAWSRSRPGVAATRTRNAAELVDTWLGRIAVRGPSFVTMSSETGTFQVTLVNGLDQPVTIGLRASVSNDRLKLTTPEAIQLPPRGRGAMRIDAVASDIGIHLVTLQPVSADGTAVGDSSRMSIRSSNVGLILWVVMAVGGGALFAMVAFRIVRRIMQRRRTHGPLLKAGAR